MRVVARVLEAPMAQRTRATLPAPCFPQTQVAFWVRRSLTNGAVLTRRTSARETLAQIPREQRLLSCNNSTTWVAHLKYSHTLFRVAGHESKDYVGLPSCFYQPGNWFTRMGIVVEKAVLFHTAESRPIDLKFIMNALTFKLSSFLRRKCRFTARHHENPSRNIFNKNYNQYGRSKTNSDSCDVTHISANGSRAPLEVLLRKN